MTEYQNPITRMIQDCKTRYYEHGETVTNLTGLHTITRSFWRTFGTIVGGKIYSKWRDRKWT